MLINYMGTPLGIHIGINRAPIIFGVLGVPGFIMILIAQIFC